MMQTLHNLAMTKSDWMINAIPFVLISPVIFFIPNDVFTLYPWVQGYTDFVASLVPMIDRTAHLHPQPDKFRAFHAYAWSWFPIFIVLSLLFFRLSVDRMNSYWASVWPRQVTLFLTVLVSMWCIFMIFVVPGDDGTTSTLISRVDPRARFYRNDFYLSATAPFFIFVTAAFVAFIAAYMLRHIQNIAHRKNNGN